jgi:hypothetical protein
MTNPTLVLFGWHRGLAYTLLLTLGMATLEMLLPNAGLFGDSPLASAAGGTLGYGLTAALVVAMTAFAVPRLSPLGLGLATLACALLVLGIRFAWPTPFVNMDSILGTGLTLGTSLKKQATALYLVWGTLLYSGLFVGAHALAWRAERVQARLAQAEIARSRSETLFDQARLSSLQGVVDPAFVLRVLDTLRRLYATDVAAAERLLDRLVAFLRLAMPAVRSGCSTLGAEVAIARSYLDLHAALDPQRPAWRCEIDAALDDTPFPPLLLLPVLDALAVQAAPGSPPLRLAARCEGANAVLSLHGQASAGWLPEALLHRLRVGLHAVHGSAVAVAVAAGAHDDATVLTTTFPSAAPAHPSPPQQLSGGFPPWTQDRLATTTTTTTN